MFCMYINNFIIKILNNYINYLNQIDLLFN